MAENHRFEIEEVSDVTIVRFTDKKILDENNVRIIGDAMFALVDTDGRKKIIVDFLRVDYLSAMGLGKLKTLHKKLTAAKGKLRLCNIRPDIYTAFAVTGLHKLFDIKENQEKALRDF